jgi:hypothetical protein
MKLRLQGNSLRLRLTKSEVARLTTNGAVEWSASFNSGDSLTYRIQTGAAAGPLRAHFGGGAITVTAHEVAVRAWADGDDVGLYAQDGDMTIAVEKDFRCLTRVQDEPDAYPNPASGCN